MASDFKKKLALKNKEREETSLKSAGLVKIEEGDAPQLKDIPQSELRMISRGNLEADGQIIRVPVGEIYTVVQVRPEEDFEESALNDMAESYEEFGILQPPRVFPKDKKGYRIWFGETRWRTARKKGLTHIDVYVGRPPRDERTRVLGQLIENLHQSGLKPLAVAEALKELKHAHDMTGEQISKSIGKPIAFVSKHLRLAEAPDAVRSLLHSKITRDVDLAYMLCQINDISPELTATLCAQAVAGNLSRKDTKVALEKIKSNKKPTLKNPKPTRQQSELPSSCDRKLPHDGKVQLPPLTEALQAPVRLNVEIVELGVRGYILLDKIDDEYGQIWIQTDSGEYCVPATEVKILGLRKYA